MCVAQALMPAAPAFVPAFGACKGIRTRRLFSVPSALMPRRRNSVASVLETFFAFLGVSASRRWNHLSVFSALSPLLRGSASKTRHLVCLRLCCSAGQVGPTLS